MGSRSRLHTAWLLVACALLLISCRPKMPPAPPEFEDPQRAPTGQSWLEEAILEAESLSRMTDEELEELRKRASADFATDRDLSTYVAVLTGRGRTADALTFLHERAWRAVDDQGKAADALAFAMGQLRWNVCADMAKEYLKLRHSSGAFLIRALCLERAGNHGAAVENVQAAAEVGQLEPDLVVQFVQLMEKRSSSGPLPPGDQRVYEDLMLRVVRREILDRLFVHELMGRWPEELLGSVEPGQLTWEDIRQVLDSRSRSYRHCYHLANFDSKKREQLSGRAIIEFQIGPLGEVLNPRPVLSEWGDHPKGSELNGCLIGQIERLRFPRPRYGLVQLARHEFSFRPD